MNQRQNLARSSRAEAELEQRGKGWGLFPGGQSLRLPREQLVRVAGALQSQVGILYFDFLKIFENYFIRGECTTYIYEEGVM